VVLDSDQRSALVPAAVASDGRLECGGGYAKPIAPKEASLRLLPSQLPAGWSLARVFARSESMTGWCTPPSLVALQTQPDGSVTGSVKVTGPVRAIFPGDQPLTEDTIAGRSAARWGDDDVPFYAWVWTDDEGRQWHAEVQGYRLAEARDLMAAVGNDGTTPTWAAAKAPGLDLVHRRTGPPYPTTWRTLAWYLDFRVGESERSLHFGQRYDTIVPLTVGAGWRLITVAGRPAAVSDSLKYSDTEASVKGGAGFHFLMIEVRPGVVLETELRDGELDEIEQVVASLVDVDPDDPRLEQYRLRE
jgi:hypothetical protein